MQQSTRAAQPLTQGLSQPRWPRIKHHVRKAMAVLNAAELSMGMVQRMAPKDMLRSTLRAALSHALALLAALLGRVGSDGLQRRSEPFILGRSKK